MNYYPTCLILSVSFRDRERILRRGSGWSGKRTTAQEGEQVDQPQGRLGTLYIMQWKLPTCLWKFQNYLLRLSTSYWWWFCSVTIISHPPPILDSWFFESKLPRVIDCQWTGQNNNFFGGQRTILVTLFCDNIWNILGLSYFYEFPDTLTVQLKSNTALKEVGAPGFMQEMP